jgi:hypothetical protein
MQQMPIPNHDPNMLCPMITIPETHYNHIIGEQAHIENL